MSVHLLVERDPGRKGTPAAYRSGCGQARPIPRGLLLDDGAPWATAWGTEVTCPDCLERRRG